MSKGIHCDRQGCDSWIRANTELADNAGFIQIRIGRRYRQRLDFCSWDCCLIHGSGKEPITTIPA